MKLLVIISTLLFTVAYGQEPPPKPPDLVPPPDYDESEFYLPYEVEAQYPGGQKALFEFIAENVIYPQDAIENGDQGKVYVWFMIDSTGDVKDAEVMRGVSPSLDKEALRVINMMPCWTPAEVEGKRVNIKYTLPIIFRLD